MNKYTKSHCLMKPNKQKIFSTQPSKPGTSLSALKPSRGQSISTSIQEFQLKSITKNLHVKSTSAPFKLLAFPDSPNHKKPAKNHIPPYPNLNHSSSHKSKSPQKPLSTSEDLNMQTFDSISYRKENSESFIRTFPNKYWCQSCKKEVFSRVKLTSPQVNV